MRVRRDKACRPPCRVGFSSDDRPLVIPHVVAYAVYQATTAPAPVEYEAASVASVEGDPAFRLTDRLRADPEVASFIREANALAADLEGRNEARIPPTCT